MSIPASFLSAVLPQSLPIVERTARKVVQQATEAFGEWFQPPEGDNGRSVPTSEAKTEPSSPPPSDRLQDKLALWIRSVAKSIGMTGPLPDIAVVSDGVGIPTIEGPENLSGPLRQSLQSQPDLIEAINQVSRDQQASDPLQWMPGYEPQVRWSIINK
jgi:hypothetical protein